MTGPDDKRVGVLFVCMGNICRSPLAEAVFRHRAGQRGVSERFEVDSAGTGGWHVGEPPDRRAREIAASHGVVLTGRARQVSRRDFYRFDHLICMDASNRGDLVQLGAPPEKLRLLLEFHSTSTVHDVPDPYYGGADGFRTVYRLIDLACEALLEELLASVP